MLLLAVRTTQWGHHSRLVSSLWVRRRPLFELMLDDDARGWLLFV